MEMPGRIWHGVSDHFRYTHNDQEKETEIFAGANSAEYWMYDSRIGRRWEIDPLAEPWQSPYAAFNNNPIYFADPLGLDGEPNGGVSPTPQPVPPSPAPNPGPSAPGGPDTPSGSAAPKIDANKVMSYIVSAAINTNIDKTQSNKPFIDAVMNGLVNAVNANSAFGIGYKSPDDYSNNEYLNYLYANGQLLGDALSMGMGVAEVMGGDGAVGTGLITAAAGGSGLVVAGVGVILIGHGTSVIANGTANAVKTTMYLMSKDKHNGKNGNEKKYDRDKPKKGIDDGYVDIKFEKMKQGNNTKKNKEFEGVMKKYKIKDKNKIREAHDIISGQGLENFKAIEKYLKDYGFFD